MFCNDNDIKIKDTCNQQMYSSLDYEETVLLLEHLSLNSLFMNLRHLHYFRWSLSKISWFVSLDEFSGLQIASIKLKSSYFFTWAAVLVLKYKMRHPYRNDGNNGTY